MKARNNTAKHRENRLAAHGFSERAEADLDAASDKLRAAFNDPKVEQVELTRDQASAVFLRMAQLESMIFVMAAKALAP